jgi:hypothetical protein
MPASVVVRPRALVVVAAVVGISGSSPRAQWMTLLIRATTVPSTSRLCARDSQADPAPTHALRWLRRPRRWGRLRLRPAQAAASGGSDTQLKLGAEDVEALQAELIWLIPCWMVGLVPPLDELAVPEMRKCVADNRGAGRAPKMKISCGLPFLLE